MTRKWRHWALCVVLATGSVLAAWSLDQVSFFQNLNLKAYDAHFVVRNYIVGPPAISNIVLLTADQKAMDTFPELQEFWNKHYADAITAAGEAGAKVIGLDLAFGIPIDKWVKDADELLGGAVSSSPVPVVVGYVERLQSNKASQQIPIDMIAAALGLAAFANLTIDPDDFCRQQELMEAPSAKPGDPPPERSLAMRLSRSIRARMRSCGTAGSRCRGARSLRRIEASLSITPAVLERSPESPWLISTPLPRPETKPSSGSG